MIMLFQTWLPLVLFPETNKPFPEHRARTQVQPAD